MALNFPAYFARAVTARMDELGVTELALHKATLIPRITISRRLTGADWKSTEMTLIAAALGTTVAELASEAERIEATESAA